MSKAMPKWKRLSGVLCIRYGSATVTISTAWLRISHDPTFDEGETYSKKFRSMLRFNSSNELRVGDFLIVNMNNFKRVFCVIKTSVADNNLYAFCHELSSIIPDEFSFSTIEDFWTVSGAGFSVNDLGVLVLTPPIGSLASHGAFLYQTISGDFDIWCHAKSPNGSGSNIWRAYIGVRIGDKGVYSVLMRDGGLNAARIDQTDSATQSETVFPIVDEVMQHLRIRRTGKMIYTYYGYSTNGETIPDWILLEPTGVVVSSSDDAIVGLGGYLSASAPGNFRFDFFRNWLVP